MEKLPTEVLQHILSHLGTPLAPYASVSRSFQMLIEPITFAKIETSSASDDVERFESAFASLYRRRFLRRLKFKVLLPDISDKRMNKLQSTDEATKNDRVYTDAVHAFFRRMSSWDEYNDDHDGFTPSFHLVIASASPKDGTKPVIPSNHDYPAWEVRNNYKYIDFKDLDHLPPIKWVTSFTTDGRRLRPNTLGTIVAALPNLKSLEWWFYTAPRRMATLWADLRDSMASLISQLARLPLLEDVEIYSEDDDPWNHDWEPMNVTSAAGTDQLSIAVSQLSQLPRLRRLGLGGLHTLLPAAFEANTTNPWPSVEDFTIEVCTIAPDGQWYFTGDRETAERPTDEPADESDSDASEAALDSEDSDASDFLPEFAWRRLNGEIPYLDYRRHPDPDVFNPLIIAIARAVVSMPLLKFFACEFSGSRAASIRCLRPPPKGTIDDSLSSTPEALWTILMEKEIEDGGDSNWTPPSEMVKILEAANHLLIVQRTG